VEGSSSTRFESEVLTAKRSGATVIRTVMLSGRRYETFKTLAEYREFKAQSWKRLQLAEPVLAKHGMRLAVENQARRVPLRRRPASGLFGPISNG
jgi:hypothetical protein